MTHDTSGPHHKTVLRRHVIFAYRVALLFLMSFSSFVVIGYAAGLAACSLLIFRTLMAPAVLDQMFFVFMVSSLGIVGAMGRGRLGSLSADWGNRHGLAAWMRNAAWVNGWVFATLNSLVLAVVIALPEVLRSNALELGGPALLFEGFLLAMDVVLSSALFDVMEVFDLHLASIEAQSVLGRSIVLLAKLVLGLTFISSCATLHGFGESPKMRIWLEDLGWMGSISLAVLGIFGLLAYIAAQDVIHHP